MIPMLWNRDHGLSAKLHYHLQKIIGPSLLKISLSRCPFQKLAENLEEKGWLDFVAMPNWKYIRS